MSSASWITSVSCLSPEIQSSEGTSASITFQWLRFIILSPCPQRTLLSSVDVLFLLAFLVFAVQKLYSKFTGLSSGLHKPPTRCNRASLRTSAWFKLSLIVSVLLAFCYTVLCILTFSGSTQLPWKLVDGLFWLIQAITHAVITILIIHEKRFQAVTHPLSLQIYWLANFIVTALWYYMFGLCRRTRRPQFDIGWYTVSMVSFPLSVLLLLASMRSTALLFPKHFPIPLVIRNRQNLRPGPSPHSLGPSHVCAHNTGLGPHKEEVSVGPEEAVVLSDEGDGDSNDKKFWETRTTQICFWRKPQSARPNFLFFHFLSYLFSQFPSNQVENNRYVFTK